MSTRAPPVRCRGMRVLLLDGFREGEDRSSIVESSIGELTGKGHEIDRIALEAEGFGTFMTAEERAAYHTEDNLISDETRRSAASVRAADALLICCPVVFGSVPPLLKSWFERVFVPEVSFTFTRSGKVTRNLGHIRRVGMVLWCPDEDSGAHRRNSPSRSLSRLAWLSGPRRRRITYLPISPGDSVPDRIAAALAHW